MDDDARPVPKLRIVSKIQKSETGSTLHFVDGSKALLDAQNEEYEFYLSLAEDSHEWQQPISITLSESASISEIGPADCNTVEHLMAQKNGGLDVHFAGHEGIFHLAKDHPNFAGLEKILQDAAQHGKRVWFGMQLPSMKITDVLTFKEPPDSDK